MNESLRSEVLRLTRGILDHTIEPVDGCRALVSVLRGCGSEIQEHPAVLTLRGVESEMDIFPIGPQRQLWGSSELARLDRERDEYWTQVEFEVRRACVEVLQLAAAE